MTVNSYDRNILKKGILYVFLIIITILIIVLELIKFECKNTYKFKKYKDNILIEVKLSDLIKIESSNYLVIDKKKYDFIIVNNYLNNKTCLLEIKIKGSIKEFNSYEVSFIRVIEIRKFIVNSMKGDKKWNY